MNQEQMQALQERDYFNSKDVFATALDYLKDNPSDGFKIVYDVNQLIYGYIPYIVTCNLTISQRKYLKVVFPYVKKAIINYFNKKGVPCANIELLRETPENNQQGE